MSDHVESLQYRADVDQALRRIRDLEGQVARTHGDHDRRVGLMGRAWGGLGTSISGTIRILGGVAAAAGTAFGAIGTYGIRAAADFQQTRIAFEGLLGSAQEADQFLRDLRDFAARTPFEMEGLEDSSRRLIAMGRNTQDVIPIMTTLGDVVAALGGGAPEIDRITLAFGQIESRGRLALEEINQIAEAVPGFSPLAAIADHFGITTGEAMDRISAGAIPAREGIDAILEGMGEFPGAAGGMERQSMTLNGVISTLKDNFRNAMVDGIEPFLPRLADMVTAITPLVSQATVGGIHAVAAGFERLGALGGAGLANFNLFMAGVRGDDGVKASGIGAGMRDIGAGVGSLVDALDRFSGPIHDFVQELLPLQDVVSVVSDTVDVWGAFSNLSLPDILNAVAIGLERVSAWLIDHSDDISLVFTTLAGGIVWAATQADKYAPVIRDAMADVVDWARANWPAARDTIVDVFASVRVVAGEVASFLETQVRGAWEGLTDEWERSGPRIMGALDDLRSAAGQVHDWWVQNWPAIGGILGQTLDRAGPVLSHFAGAVSSTFAAIAAFIDEVFLPIWNSGLGEGAITTIALFAAGVIGFVDGVLVAITGLMDFLTAVFHGEWSQAWTSLGTLVSGVAQSIVGAIEIIVAPLTGLLDWLDQLTDGQLAAGLTGLGQAAQNMAQPFVEAFGGMSEAVASMAGAVSEGVAGVTGAFDSMGNGAVTAVSTVREALGGINEDVIVGAIGDAGSWLRGFGGDLVAGLKGGAIDAWNGVMAWFRDRDDRIRATLADAATWLVEVGRSIVTGIKDGINREWDSFISWWEGKLDGIIGSAVDAILPGSPSRVFREQIGLPIIQGIGAGIEDGAPAAVASLVEQLDRIKAVARASGIGITEEMAAGILDGRTAFGDALGQIRDMALQQLGDIQSAISGAFSFGGAQDRVADLKAQRQAMVAALSTASDATYFEEVAPNVYAATSERQKRQAELDKINQQLAMAQLQVIQQYGQLADLGQKITATGAGQFYNLGLAAGVSPADVQALLALLQEAEAASGRYGTAGLVPLASGGIVMPRTGGLPALVGEGGRAEAVIPLDQLGRFLPGGGGGGGTTVLHLEVHGSVVREAELVETMSEGLAKLRRAQGRLPFEDAA